MKWRWAAKLGYKEKKKWGVLEFERGKKFPQVIPLSGYDISCHSVTNYENAIRELLKMKMEEENAMNNSIKL